ncbi:MAG: hypothetical protein [Microvirus sp.]|nr:MAG: hypothetical protein [Microvirus sp.]
MNYCLHQIVNSVRCIKAEKSPQAIGEILNNIVTNSESKKEPATLKMSQCHEHLIYPMHPVIRIITKSTFTYLWYVGYKV